MPSRRRPARIGLSMASLTALADAIYREEVARARAMPAGEKLLEGPRLFDRACRVMAIAQSMTR